KDKFLFLIFGTYKLYFMLLKKYLSIKSIMPLAIVLSTVLVISSCGSKRASRGDVSSKTGVAYNDPHNGGLHINRKVKETPGPGLVAIEGGTFVMGGSLNEDLGYSHDNLKRRVTVASFYIDETEVSNADWLE